MRWLPSSAAASGPAGVSKTNPREREGERERAHSRLPLSPFFSSPSWSRANPATKTTAFAVQRRYLDYKYRGPETATQLWTGEQLAESAYDKGTVMTDHFEVVDRAPGAITIRCGDSPRKQGLRPSDGLFVISATVDKKRDEVELGLKSCLFSSEGKVSGTRGPMPPWMEELHQWYARMWSEAGSRRLLK